MCLLTRLDLHSNLVIFKFFQNHIAVLSPMLFTFQSGDIQIIYVSPHYLLYNTFTFQSGDIQIIPYVSKVKTVCTIYIPIWWYSNESVIDDLKAKSLIYIPIWWYSNIICSNMLLSTICAFTFQSGDIQIIRPKAQAIGKILFTFQSGDIQIIKSSCRKLGRIKIYIPIWWYSNVWILGISW